MEILTWFVTGIVVTNIMFFIYWWRGNDIEYVDIFIYIACVLSGPISIIMPLFAAFCYWVVIATMKIESIREEPFLKGRVKNKKNNDDEYI